MGPRRPRRAASLIRESAGRDRLSHSRDGESRHPGRDSAQVPLGTLTQACGGRPLGPEPVSAGHILSGYVHCSAWTLLCNCAPTPCESCRRRRWTLRVVTVRVVLIAPNRAAAPRDSLFGQNEPLCDSAILRDSRFGQN